MTARLCVFEDDRIGQLNPLVLFRPVYDLRCGITTLLEKIVSAAPRVPVSLACRSHLTNVVRQQFPIMPVHSVDAAVGIFWNGRAIADRRLIRGLLNLRQDIVFTSGSLVVAARLSGKALERLRGWMGREIGSEAFDGIVREEVAAEWIAFPWDLVTRNGKQIVADAALMRKTEKKRGRHKPVAGVHYVSSRDILIGEGAVMKPGVVLDASDGPIVIGPNVQVLPQATILGPASIGNGSVVKVGAQVYGETTIGPMCKVGGEVVASLLHSYSNKQHGGFLGHAYLGSWVNLGADTNNSNLKNNSGTVKVVVNGVPVDTGLQFFGLLMGDHSKSAISTTFNTGTVVGVSSNIFGHGFPPKYIPSFTWGPVAGSASEYEVEKATEVARRVMARRNVVMTPVDEQLFRDIFAMTAGERMNRTLNNFVE